ncbi:MAG: ferric reductase-like transmembrane domain-containing protein [Phycisphaerae bacterium]
MSVGYVAVQWNRHKRVYDAVLVSGVAAYLGVYVGLGRLLFIGAEAISAEILALRALGSCAFLLLTLTLCIGPLARLNPRFLPLLYNRRHLGVATFVVALLHGALATGFYHGFGVVNPLMSLLTGNTSYGSLRAFPFQVLGLAALLILFLMAATSHDFWNRNLGPRLWKALHMLVYPAYSLVVLHVALGALQTPRAAWLAPLVAGAALLVVALHIITGWRERNADKRSAEPIQHSTEWIDAGDAGDIPDGRARIVCAQGGERIAVFRHGACVSAITNVCVHQGGPLGEGRILDGCVTCPWHGWQYRPADGQAPPPFTERIVTYSVRVSGGRVRVNAKPLPPGTPVQPAAIEAVHERE